MRLIAVTILILGCAFSGCFSNPTAPDSTPVNITNPSAQKVGPSHVPWGQWDISIRPESLTAEVAPVRSADAHFNVTPFLYPPNCSDCVLIQIMAWDPVERIVTVKLTLENPTYLPGYDVKAILTNYETKEFLEPDAWCDFYTDGTTWNPYYTFATENEDNYFGDGEIHAVEFKVYFPVGATPNATITVDASFPGPQTEPWKIDSIVMAGPLQNDNYHHISFTCRILDHQDNVAVVLINLQPFGPQNAALGDDSFHRDYGANDGIWGLENIKTSYTPGMYECWVKAGDVMATHYTYQKVVFEIITPVAQEPPLYIVSMMHAEEELFYLNETTYLGYSDTLRKLQNVFDTHGGKIALQPDWTFIEGTMDFDPTLFADFQAAVHGIDAHAHETQYDIGYVHDLLDSAGVTDTIIANGGFNKTYGIDGNWVAYLASFTLAGTGEPMFQAVNAYKDPASQTVDGLYTPIRPSTTGPWMVHDPDGPLIYIPGAPENGLTGSSPQFFTLLPDAVDYALAGRIPGKINTFYWHDPVNKYSGDALSLTRISFWNQLFLDYFNQKVSTGDIVWANFNEMTQIYLDWEDN